MSTALPRLAGDLPVSVGFANYQPSLTDAGALRDFCQALEDLGYAGVQCQDHLVYPWDESAYGSSAGGRAAHYPGQQVLEAFTFLATAAGCSQHLTLETSLIVLPQRHPLLVAKQAAAIDRLSGGRLLLGVGPGWLRDEMRALGWDPATRGERMDEALEIICRALDEPRVGYDGRHFRFEEVSLEPRPTRPADQLPWIGGGEANGLGPAMRRLGRHAAGWLVNPRLPLEQVPPALESARAEARAAGRGEVEFGLDVIIVFDGDASGLAEALAERREVGATRLTVLLGGVRPAAHLDELIGRAATFAEAVRA